MLARRIFVVGVPRSGTTLVQGLLAAHSRVTSFTESHFFSRHFVLLPGTSTAVLRRDPRPRLREFLAENAVEPAAAAAGLERRFDQTVPARFLLPLATRRVARRMVWVLDELARIRGAEAWVEKTPRHLRYVPFLERLSDPETPTSFVHVIRDGLETVASLLTASRNWERPYDLEACVRRWNADVGFSLRRAVGPSDHFVFYERLTADPERVLERLFAALEVAWEPAVLARFAEDRGRWVTPEESWKSNAPSSVRASATSDRALTPEQRRLARRGLRDELYQRLLARSEP